MKNTHRKTYFAFAGVNGSGKTTLFKTHEFFDLGVRINNDEILNSNKGDWNSLNDQSIALMTSLRLMQNAIKNNQNINHETVLSGDSEKFINMIKECGYYIVLYYVGLNSVDLALQRVEDRVKKGGHGIPKEDVVRRYNESMSNLKRIINLCDEVYFYDNSTDLKIIATCIDGIWDVIDKYCLWFNKLSLVK